MGLQTCLESPLEPSHPSTKLTPQKQDPIIPRLLDGGVFLILPSRPFYRQLTIGSLLPLVLMTEETT